MSLLFADYKVLCQDLEELPVPQEDSDAMDAEYLEWYIAQCRKRLDVLLKRRDKLRFLGTSEDSRTWRSNAYDIMYTRNEIENSISAVKEISPK